MRTYQLDGVVTALSSISHGGGESNGVTAQLRREKFVQPNGAVERIPVISGNSFRGILRDTGMFQMLRMLGYGVDEEKKEVGGLSLQAFYFLFSGGALVSTGSGALDIDYFRKMKATIPLISLFGGAAGNAIMPGKIKIGKLIPISNETVHLLPEKFSQEKTESIWEYCQEEMYTRKDDEKNDRLRRMLPGGSNAPAIKEKGAPQQMMYNVETLAAGTRFYWRLILEDVNDIEFEAFLSTLLEFSKRPYIGGKSAVGHGEVAINLENWIEIDSRVNLKGDELDAKIGDKYKSHMSEKGEEIRTFLKNIQ